MCVLLRCNSALTLLNLGANRLGAGLDELVQALAYNPPLKALNVDKTQVAGEGTMGLLRGLHSNSMLQSLQLQDNGIDDTILCACAEALASSSVEVLLLGKNRIGDTGGGLQDDGYVRVKFDNGKGGAGWNFV